MGRLSSPDKRAKCLLFSLSAFVPFPIKTTNKIALLSWIDAKGKNPTIDDLDEFTQSVSNTVSILSLPATICTADQLRDFVSQLVPSNLSGVAAVVGGILSQDVLNALGGRELPLKNWLFFDGGSCIPPTLCGLHSRRREDLQSNGKDKRRSVIMKDTKVS
jgi:hypothetical protein